MTRIAREAVRPSDRAIVEALEWVAKNDGRIIFADGTIGVTVGVFHVDGTEQDGLVPLINSIRDDNRGAI